MVQKRALNNTTNTTKILFSANDHQYATLNNKEITYNFDSRDPDESIQLVQNIGQVIDDIRVVFGPVSVRSGSIVELFNGLLKHYPMNVPRQVTINDNMIDVKIDDDNNMSAGRANDSSIQKVVIDKVYINSDRLNLALKNMDYLDCLLLRAPDTSCYLYLTSPAIEINQFDLIIPAFEFLHDMLYAEVYIKVCQYASGRNEYHVLRLHEENETIIKEKIESDNEFCELLNSHQEYYDSNYLVKIQVSKLNSLVIKMENRVIFQANNLAAVTPVTEAMPTTTPSATTAQAEHDLSMVEEAMNAKVDNTQGSISSHAREATTAAAEFEADLGTE